ncbi:hypothetical protein C8R44DRAFT_848352 [Mycena epipterygia]|nr:hypothetical protein C8R44DRAFT_848352 [Mycena epipterygia]
MFNKSLLIGVAAAMFMGTARAFTGTASIWTFPDDQVTSCNCSASNGPLAVAIPSALVGTEICCTVEITATFNGKSVPAVFSGIFDAAAGAENIALTPTAFALLADNSGETTLSPVTWSFNA